MGFTRDVFSAYERRLAALQASNNPFAQGIAYIEGKYTPMAEARVPLADQGFLRSDLTYDVAAVWDGRFFRLDDHLDRFFASMATLRMTSPMPREEMRARLIEMIAMSGLRDAYVMLTITRGLRYIRQYAPEDCENLLYLSAIPFLWVMSPEIQAKGGSAVIARTVRRTPPGAVDPRVKNLQWGDFTRGLLEARDRGAQYPILTDGDGNITEGAGYNVVLAKGGRLYSARRGVLEGVTLKTIFEIADRLGIGWTLDEIPVSLAYESEEIFFVTTAGGVMPVTRLDGEPIGAGEVGPLTRRLWQAFWEAQYDPRLSFAVDYR